jgi:hypothetical protein
MTTARFILTRFGRLVAFLGLAVWIVGTVWSWASGAAGLFQRFGALGVAASVLFFSDRLLKIELGRQRSVERLLHEYGVELAEMKRGTPPTELPKEGYAVDFLTEERNFGALRRQADIFNVANTILLTIATLQWGFGDRLVNELIGCGAPIC